MSMNSLWMFYVAAVFLAIRLVLRKATRAEIWMLVFVVASFLLIKGQQVAEHLGQCRFEDVETFWRYHLPTLPLVAAVMAVFLGAVWRWRGWIGKALAILAVVATVGDSVHKFAKHEKKWRPFMRDLAAAEVWASDVIARDWKGPSSDGRLDGAENYLGNGLPSVFSFGGFVPYRIGGRTPGADIRGVHDIRPLETADYMCCPNWFSTNAVAEFVRAGADCIAERRFGPSLYRIYKRRDAERLRRQE